MFYCGHCITNNLKTIFTMHLRNLWPVVFVLLSHHFFTGSATSNGIGNNSMELELVQIIFRHGERTPHKMEYDLLNYTDLSAYKPFGLNQLTNNGKMQAYKVGEMLKERYKNFLNESYNSQHVYARSTESERTRMTMQLVLAGLFPPNKELQWHPALNWMPIPYRYVPAELDSLLKPQETKKFIKLRTDVWKTDWGLETLAEFKDLFEMLDEHGIKVRKTIAKDIHLLHNILQIHERLNFSLPEWYTAEVKPRFQKAFKMHHESLMHTKELKRLNAGPIVKAFINNMNLNQSVENLKKLYLYSGHDLNIGGVLKALMVHGFEDFDFCTTLILEKWKDSNSQVYARLIHWDAIKEKLSNTRMGNCEEFCPIDDFLELIRDVIPTDEELFSMYKQYDRFKKLVSFVWQTFWGLENLAQYKDVFKFLDKHASNKFKTE